MPDPLLVAARAVHYAALVQFAGLFVFLRLVLEPTLRESRTTDTAALHKRFMAIAWGSIILILLSDDMGFSDAGCYGGEIATPNLEALGHRAFGRDWVGLDPPRHLVLFTTASLTERRLSAVVLSAMITGLTSPSSSSWSGAAMT